MKAFHSSILQFLDEEDFITNNFQNLSKIITDLKMKNASHNLKIILHMIVKISNNHHRSTNFFAKIEQILLLYKDFINNYYSNYDIFNTFKSNKRLLLFLIKEKMLIVDEMIVQTITTSKYVKMKYPEYFLPEIKPFITDDWIQESIRNNSDDLLKWIHLLNKELPEDFEKNREIGENEANFCQMIRNDSIVDFIEYNSQTNLLECKNYIEISIYETNPFLLKKDETTFIEYAAFFGSIQIFQYLKEKNMKINPSMWLYSIHGFNAEIIQKLQEMYLDMNDKIFEENLIESIKCHHNEMANYFINNSYIEEYQCSYYTFIHSVKNYNAELINSEYKYKGSLLCLYCQYDYYPTVKSILQRKDNDINESIIYQI